MTEQMTPDFALAAMHSAASLAEDRGLPINAQNMRLAIDAVAALIARNAELEAESIGRDLGEVHALIAENAALQTENEGLRAVYHKARNAAAGFSNYCEDSANSRRCERELAEAERMFRDIDAARAEAGHG